MNWELVKACTVAIATPEGYIQGTGFFISPNGHLLTCAHVVESAGGWENVRVNGQGVELVYLGDRIFHTQLIITYLTHIFLGRMPTNLHPKPPRFLNEPITMTFIIHIKPITRCPTC